MALVSPGIQISINDQSQYVNSNVGSVPLVLLATAQDKTYNGSAATGTTKANAGKLQSFTSQRDLVTAMGTPSFELSSAGTPVNASERNEYGLLAAYSALGLGNRLFAIRADVDLNQLKGTSVRPAGQVADGTYWLDLANTEFGIYELNRGVTPERFDRISPLLITDPVQVTSDANPAPLPSVGSQGSYALVFVTSANATPSVIRLWYKTNTTCYGGTTAPANLGWVEVGSDNWAYSVPALQSTNPGATITSVGSSNPDFYVNGVAVGTAGASGTKTVAEVAAAINSATITGVKAIALDGLLTFFVTSEAASNGVDADGKLVLQDTSTNSPLAALGIKTKTNTSVPNYPTSGADYYSPTLVYGSYAYTPIGGWFSTDTQPKPSGSIWWKTTSTGGGFSPVLKKYNSSLQEWVSQITPEYQSYDIAIVGTTVTAGLDPISGGINIAKGQIIATYEVDDATTQHNNLKFSTQSTQGDLVVTGTEPAGLAAFNGASFIIQATKPGTVLGTGVVVQLTGTTAQSFVADLLNAGVPYVTAQVNANGTISIIHTTGGVITLADAPGDTGLLAAAGFANGTSPYLQVLATGQLLLSNFTPITMDIHYSTETPYAAPANGTLWYYSNLADLDIMINDNGWKGYRRVSSDARGYNLTTTDTNGVIVSATAPSFQSDGTTNLAQGDLWLNSSDVVNYPALSRYNGTNWVAIDNADHVSNNGIIFADARWDGATDDTGGDTDPVSDALPSITTLLSSNYIDLDAPDYRLYPRGTLLFNTRRSGYNVKKFVSDYFNTTSFPGNNVTVKNSWVSDSGLNEQGAMYAGTAAQRAIVVAALKSAIDSNTDILDANYQFNLLVTPGYPELIPNLVTLNDNRGGTAFVIGDTPMTLAPTASALTAWNTNSNGNGLATSSPYLGVYYPAGLTNDLAGNRVAVPASHAVLRTFLYNDNVSYQWFAPAGVHRGLVSNLSDIGYVNPQTGAFIHNGVNQGLRDTLYTLSINPITQLPGTGLVVWGQETKSGDTTARNRVNVVRLENYLRTIFATISNSFLFEPNDTITRKSIATQIESALHNLLSKRGLYDFLVICDTSNNTPSTIANNQLYVDVAIEPMRDVEFIYIPIALYNPGTVASLGAANT